MVGPRTKRSPLPRAITEGGILGKASVKSRGAVTDNSRKTLGLYPSRDFPSRLHRVCLFRIVRESSANRLRIAGKLARKIRSDKPRSDYQKTTASSPRAAGSDCCADYLRIAWKLGANLFSRGGFSGFLPPPFTCTQFAKGATSLAGGCGSLSHALMRAG